MSPTKYLPFLALSATTACQIQTDPNSRANNSADSSGLKTSEFTGDALVEAGPHARPATSAGIQRVEDAVRFRDTNEGPLPPPIVGGDTTSDFEPVGALVVLDRRGDILASFCSGTLIDDSTVLTAAHCVDALDDIAALGLTEFEFVIGTNVYTPSGAWERLAITEMT